MSTAPFSFMTPVYQALGEIITARLQGDTNAEEIRKVLRQEFNTTRHSLVRDTQTLSDVWAKLRPSAAVTDFLIDVTTQLSLVLAASSLPLGTVTEHLIKAAGCFTLGESVVDDDLKKRLPSDSSIKKLYEGNAWFVVLQLMQHRQHEYFKDA